MSTAALSRAIDLLGNQSRLARSIQTKPQNIWWWLHKTKTVPAEFVLDIERATGGAVTRHDLRPDLYPPDEAPLPPREAAA